MSELTVIRVVHRRCFTTIINETVEDARLSFRARGVLVWLLSKPDGWRVNAREIYRFGTEGRDAVMVALGELETCGYLRREKVQMPGGKWITRSFLYESPSPENPDSVDVENAENQDSVNQDSVFQDLSTKDSEVKTQNKRHGDDGFAEFWNAYPVSRRGGSPSAKKAWKKIDPDEHLVIMLGLSLWVKFWEESGTDPQFIKLAASWLNDRRWECPPKPKPVPVVVIRPCIMCAAPNPREECNGPNYIGPDFDMVECPWRR